MEQLVAWISRLQQSQVSDLAEYLFRATVPGSQALTIKECMISADPLGEIAPRPGDSTPVSASLFRFLDVNEPSRSIEVHQQLVSEIAAVLTLASERRVEIAHEIAMRVENQPQVTFIGYGGMIDRRLVGPIGEQLAKPFLEWLSKIVSLPEPHLSVIGTACTLHHGAILLYEKDVRSAYLLLVAAIEVLSRQYGAPPTDWLDWEESSKWEKFMTRISLSSEQETALKEKLMSDKHLRLKATFRNYGSSRLPDSFWDTPWKEWIYTVNASIGQWESLQTLDEKKVSDIFSKDRTLLSKSLGLSYDVRSGLVHRGERLGLLESSVLSGVTIEEALPLPFSILRAVLLELIKTEIAEYIPESELPDLKWVAGGMLQ
ncbi:MAG: hypothetical protein HC832_07325 [Leptolyngbyaceae cyanobacterium RM1_405_57]|nr:hypothetical protein [Leptolyngbyaceae cyanobacterium RM1_405_57]